MDNKDLLEAMGLLGPIILAYSLVLWIASGISSRYATYEVSNAGNLVAMRGYWDVNDPINHLEEVDAA